MFIRSRFWRKASWPAQRALPRRLSFSPTALLSLPPDVNEDGVCAGGVVQIRACDSQAKGLGAFAMADLSPEHELGWRYAGEVLTLSEYFERYVGGGEPPDSADGFERWAVESRAHEEFVSARQARGVSVTGMYVFNAGSCPHTGRSVLVDAEDPVYANWTRFLNHSTKRPNLRAASEVVRDATGASVPVIRFLVCQPVSRGDELLFDYGDGFELGVLGFED